MFPRLGAEVCKTSKAPSLEHALHLLTSQWLIVQCKMGRTIFVLLSWMDYLETKIRDWDMLSQARILLGDHFWRASCFQWPEMFSISLQSGDLLPEHTNVLTLEKWRGIRGIFQINSLWWWSYLQFKKQKANLGISGHVCHVLTLWSASQGESNSVSSAKETSSTPITIPFIAVL